MLACRLNADRIRQWQKQMKKPQATRGKNRPVAPRTSTSDRVRDNKIDDETKKVAAQHELAVPHASKSIACGETNKNKNKLRHTKRENSTRQQVRAVSAGVVVDAVDAPLVAIQREVRRGSAKTPHLHRPGNDKTYGIRIQRRTRF